MEDLLMLWYQAYMEKDEVADDLAKCILLKMVHDLGKWMHGKD